MIYVGEILSDSLVPEEVRVVLQPVAEGLTADLNLLKHFLQGFLVPTHHLQLADLFGAFTPRLDQVQRPRIDGPVPRFRHLAVSFSVAPANVNLTIVKRWR